MAPEAWVWVARVKRTQGRKGEVFAEILTDFPEKFAQRHRLWLLREPVSGHGGGAVASHFESEPPREVQLLHYWLHKGGVVLQFAGVDSISAAEELAGFIVAIPRTERAKLQDGEIYIGDLVGCALFNVAGPQPRFVGKIEDVDRSAGPVAMLVVRPDTEPGEPQRRRDDEILIPFAKDYLRSVDVDAKRVEMALPDGLVELNS
jgi:16S rRNA processing protein RimM